MLRFVITHFAAYSNSQVKQGSVLRLCTLPQSVLNYYFHAEETLLLLYNDCLYYILFYDWKLNIISKMASVITMESSSSLYSNSICESNFSILEQNISGNELNLQGSASPQHGAGLMDLPVSTTVII